MKKRLNNYILFPILLSATCLVCGGALAGVNYITADRIALNRDRKLIKAIGKFFPDNKSKEVIELEKDVDSRIEKAYLVTTSEDKTGLAYQVTTGPGYSGTITFAMGVLDGKMIGLRQISATEDTLGVNAVNAFATSIGLTNSYELGDDFDSLVVSSGASAKITFPALQKAIDVTLEDAATRVKVEKPDSDYEVTVTQDANDIELFHSDVVSHKGFGNFSADVKVSRKVSKVLSVSIEAKDPIGENNGYGFKVLDGTATDTFTSSYVKIPDGGLTFSKFSKKPESFDQTLLAADAPITSMAYYTMMYETLVQAKKIRDITTVTLKAGTSDTYVVDHWDNGGYGNMNIDVQLDVANRLVKAVTINSHSAFADGGENYGKDIIDGNTNSGNSARDEFVKTYVKIPASGLSFDLFLAIENPISDEMDHTFQNGASYTSRGYYAAVQAAIKEALKGAAN